jgi:hypothetical protein
MKDISLHFSRDQWERLEPHLDGLASDVGVHDHVLTSDPQGRTLRCDEECYEKVLALAAKLFPDLVQHMENQKKISQPK